MVSNCFMDLTNTFSPNSFLVAGFSKVATALGSYFTDGRMTLNAQKRYFQEQLVRNEISKYQKILASIFGPVRRKIVTQN